MAFSRRLRARLMAATALVAAATVPMLTIAGQSFSDSGSGACHGRP